MTYNLYDIRCSLVLRRLEVLRIGYSGYPILYLAFYSFPRKYEWKLLDIDTHSMLRKDIPSLHCTGSLWLYMIDAYLPVVTTYHEGYDVATFVILSKNFSGYTIAVEIIRINIFHIWKSYQLSSTTNYHLQNILIQDFSSWESQPE